MKIKSKVLEVMHEPQSGIVYLAIMENKTEVCVPTPGEQKKMPYLHICLCDVHGRDDRVAAMIKEMNICLKRLLADLSINDESSIDAMFIGEKGTHAKAAVRQDYQYYCSINYTRCIGFLYNLCKVLVDAAVDSVASYRDLKVEARPIEFHISVLPIFCVKTTEVILIDRADKYTAHMKTLDANPKLFYPKQGSESEQLYLFDKLYNEKKLGEEKLTLDNFERCFHASEQPKTIQVHKSRTLSKSRRRKRGRGREKK